MYEPDPWFSLLYTESDERVVNSLEFKPLRKKHAGREIALEKTTKPEAVEGILANRSSRGRRPRSIEC